MAEWSDENIDEMARICGSVMGSGDGRKNGKRS
jgi:hypothetical protein